MKHIIRTDLKFWSTRLVWPQKTYGTPPQLWQILFQETLHVDKLAFPIVNENVAQTKLETTSQEQLYIFIKTGDSVWLYKTHE
jgi:hypothetical protein